MAAVVELGVGSCDTVTVLFIIIAAPRLVLTIVIIMALNSKNSKATWYVAIIQNYLTAVEAFLVIVHVVTVVVCSTSVSLCVHNQSSQLKMHLIPDHLHALRFIMILLSCNNRYIFFLVTQICGTSR